MSDHYYVNRSIDVFKVALCEFVETLIVKLILLDFLIESQRIRITIKTIIKAMPFPLCKYTNVNI